MGRDVLPNVPVTAVVWAVRLARTPPQLGNVHHLVRNRWRGQYGGITPGRCQTAVRHAVDRGWLTLSGPGRWAKVRMGDAARFDAEHDVGLLRGGRALQDQHASVAQAWRRAHPEAVQP